MDSQENQGVADGFRAVVTFERDKGEPVVVRLTLDDSEPDVAVRKAVFRALREAPRKWDSVVVVLDRVRTEVPESADAVARAEGTRTS